jgi:Protein of unknown function, DUF547
MHRLEYLRSRALQIKPLLVLTLVLLASLAMASGAGATGPDSLFYRGYASALDRFVDSRGMVDYQSLKANRGGLNSFVEALDSFDGERLESWSEQERIAFWLNAYNALTLKAIIDNYPIKAGFLTSLVYPGNSIRQINGVWDKLAFSVAGEPHTLERIEHEILRVRFDEPRIHMALVCAAMGCPQLRNEPYYGSRLDSQLKDQTLRFLANPAKFRIDRDKDKVYLSAIFEWFGDDFLSAFSAAGPVDKFDSPRNAVLNFIAGYLDADSRTYIAQENYKIESVRYDWSLNERSQ